MKIRQVLVLSFVLSFSVLKGQSLVGYKSSLYTDSIANFKVIALDAANSDGIINKQYSLFKSLMATADTNELLELFANKESAIVKCYVFWGLANKHYSKLFLLLKQNLYDNRLVAVCIGDFEEHYKVSDFYINVMTPDRVDVDVKKMDVENRKQLDSLLLFNDKINLQAKVDLFRNYKPIDYQYGKVRELTIKEYTPFAVVALAKFKNYNDLNYIDTLLLDEEKEYYALLAVREFPNEKFYNDLLNKHNASIKAKKINYSQLRALYQALVKYPTKQTVAQFELALKKTKGVKKTMHQKYMWLAIDKYPQDVFNEVKNKLKLTEFEKEDLEAERYY